MERRRDGDEGERKKGQKQEQTDKWWSLPQYKEERKIEKNKEMWTEVGM